MIRDKISRVWNSEDATLARGAGELAKLCEPGESNNPDGDMNSIVQKKIYRLPSATPPITGIPAKCDTSL